MQNGRTDLQQEVISALVESRAVNFDAVASVAEFAFVITRKSRDLCIPPDPFRVNAPTLANDQNA